MAQMTLKRLMELSGVDMNTPKVIVLLEMNHQTHLLVDEIDDEVRRESEYLHNDDTLKKFKEQLDGEEHLNHLVSQLAKIIGFDKAEKLLYNLANEYYTEMQV